MIQAGILGRRQILAINPIAQHQFSRSSLPYTPAGDADGPRPRLAYTDSHRHGAPRGCPRSGETVHARVEYGTRLPIMSVDSTSAVIAAADAGVGYGQTVTNQCRAVVCTAGIKAGPSCARSVHRHHQSLPSKPKPFRGRLGIALSPRPDRFTITQLNTWRGARPPRAQFNSRDDALCDTQAKRVHRLGVGDRPIIDTPGLSQATHVRAHPG